MVKVAAGALKLSVSHIDLANLNEEDYRAASDSVQKASADLTRLSICRISKP